MTNVENKVNIDNLKYGELKQIAALVGGGAFSLGDLRRARAVLDKIKGGGDE